MPISSEMKQLVKALVTEVVDDCYERGMATCGIESDSGEALIAAIEKLEAEKKENYKCFSEMQAAYKDAARDGDYWQKFAKEQIEISNARGAERDILAEQISKMATMSARKDARLTDLSHKLTEIHCCNGAVELGLLVHRMPELAVTNVDHIKLTWHQISNGKNWAVLNDDDEFLGQGDTAEAALKEAMGV